MNAFGVKFNLWLNNNENLEDLFSKYDQASGLEITLRNVEFLLEQEVYIIAKVEFLENFINSSIKITNHSPHTLQLASVQINFLDYLKELPHEITAFIPNLTLSLEVLDYQHKLLLKDNKSIQNPWFELDSFEFLNEHKIDFISKKLHPKRPIADMFDKASKLFYGDNTKIIFDNYGPQLMLDTPEGGDSPFLNFCEDFVWIKIHSKYPIIAIDRIKETRSKCLGYFIIQSDYKYLCRILSYGECSIDTFSETFKTFEYLLK